MIGARRAEGVPFLFAKLARRKNLTAGRILRRPCFCQLAATRAATLCPVHALWPLIRHRVVPGALLFKAVNRMNFNRTLKAIVARLSVPDSERYSSHAFLRGATPELKEVGSPWSGIASSGLWRSPAFRGNVDMSKDVEAGAQQLFGVDLDSASDPELD